MFHITKLVDPCSNQGKSAKSLDKKKINKMTGSVFYTKHKINGKTEVNYFYNESDCLKFFQELPEPKFNSKAPIYIESKERGSALIKQDKRNGLIYRITVSNDINFLSLYKETANRVLNSFVEEIRIR